MKNTNENLDGKKLSIETLGFKIYAVDFDGTLFEDKWPGIGAPNLKLINYLKSKKQAGNKIILWTCRVNQHLKDAIVACFNQGLEFDAVNDDIQEIKDLFPVRGPKIYYDELIDDRNNNSFDLPYYPENESNMQTWAEREVEIACKRERDAAGNTQDWDYGCACYDSALKAFNSLCKDGHSGMSSLFKYVHDDGTIRYTDVDRYVCVDIGNDVCYTTGLASRLIDEMFPITMPYSAAGKRYEVYCEDFLVDPKMGDYDTKDLVVLVLAKNVIVIGIFTVLAIYFGHWAIVLAAGLFITSISGSKNINHCSTCMYHHDNMDCDLNIGCWCANDYCSRYHEEEK